MNTTDTLKHVRNMLREALDSEDDDRSEVVGFLGVVLGYATASEDDDSPPDVDGPSEALRRLLQFLGMWYVENGDGRGLEAVGDYFYALSDYVDCRAPRNGGEHALERIQPPRRTTRGNGPRTRALETLREEYIDDLDTIVDVVLERADDIKRPEFGPPRPSREGQLISEAVEGVDRVVNTTKIVETLLVTLRLSESWNNGVGGFQTRDLGGEHNPSDVLSRVAERAIVEAVRERLRERLREEHSEGS